MAGDVEHSDVEDPEDVDTVRSVFWTRAQHRLWGEGEAPQGQEADAEEEAVVYEPESER